MSASSRSGEALDPPSDVIVQLIGRVVGEQWPSGSEQFGDYFTRLGGALGPLQEPDDETLLGVSRGQFVLLDHGIKDASWSALKNQLFDLGFFVYGGKSDTSPRDVNAGYDAVQEGISALFGPSPDERTDHRGNRAATWWTQGTVIELYAHVNEAPVLQVGASHEGRTEVYHQLIAQTPERPRN